MARMEDTRLPKCVMFGELVGGAGCVGGQEKEWVGCFLDDFRAFGINADEQTTAAQDEGEWRRTAEQGVEHFMAKWIAVEKAKAVLRHAVVCPNVTGRIKDVQLTPSRVIDKMVVDGGRALQPCRYRWCTHMSCIILYPYST